MPSGRVSWVISTAEESNVQVIIMRGITGSGKTRIVNKLFRTAVVCSADHWFERNDRKWNPGPDLRTAHDECYRKFTQALAHDMEK